MRRLVVGKNDLLTWCRNSGEWGQRLIDEWVGLDENNNIIEMNEISKGNPRKKVLWQCMANNQHKWLATANDRTNANPQKRTGCPFCAGKRVDDNNSLLSWCKEHGEYGRRLYTE